MLCYISLNFGLIINFIYIIELFFVKLLTASNSDENDY